MSEADVSTDAGTQHVLDLVEHIPSNSFLVLWGSLPCDPWSPLQHINDAVARNKGPAAHKAERFRIKRARKRSLVMLANVRKVVTAVKARLRLSETCFEWPTPSEGWQREEVQTMLHEEHMQIAQADGCCHDVVCKFSGLPLKKPFTIATTSKTLKTVLDSPKYKCSRRHQEHGQSMSGNARHTGHYTTAFCRVMLSGLFSRVPVLAASDSGEASSSVPVVVPDTDVAIFVDKNGSEIAPPVGESQSEDCELQIPSDLSVAEKLKIDATSTHHLVHHVPKNPFCPHCVRQKQVSHYARRSKDDHHDSYQ